MKSAPKLLFIIGVLVILTSLLITNVQTTFTFDQTAYDKKWNDESEIWFGQSTALTGQTKELGYPLMVGIQAAFKEINELGGVWGGKKLRLYSVDDGYEPARCVNNTLDLLSNQTIFAFIGFMGTGTSQAILDLITASKMPFVGALTGGLFMRYPFVPNIINVRASYQDECAAMVEYLVNVKMVRRISIFYQNDAFGLSGVDGSNLALKPLGMNLTSLGKYERNTINVAQAVEDIAKGNPQAIICMSTYKPTVAFIQAVKNRNDFDSNIIFMTGSFIGSNPLPYQSSIVITQVYPAPTNTKYPIVLSYQRAMKALNPSYIPSIVELEGYLAGKLAISVLTQRVSGDLTRENFINLIYSSSTYIMDNQVVGPYTKCTSVQSRRGIYYFEEQITNPLVSHSLTASLAPSIKLSKRGLRTSEDTYMSSCSCNQGMRAVWKTVQNADNSFTEIGDPMTWDLPGSATYTCFFDPSKISLPIIFGHTSDGTNYDNDFLMGLLAAFKDRNDLQKGVRGRRIEVLSVAESNSSSALISKTKNFIVDHDIVGLVGSRASQSVMKEFLGEFSSKFPSIVMISPLTCYDSPTLRSTFYNNVALVTISVRERMLAVLDYCMNTLGLSRFSYVGSKSNDGLSIFSEFSSIITAYGLAIDSSFLFSLDQSTNSSVISSSLSNNANPQAIFLSIPEDVTTFTHLQNVLEGIKSIGMRSEIHVFCFFFRQVSWEAEISNLLSNPSMASVKFYISQPFPYLSVKHTLIDSYTSIMAKYYDTNPTTTGAVEGFLVGSFIIEVLDNIPLTSSINGKSIYETLYSSKEFLKYQIPFGKFISGSCNMGMRSNFIYQYSGTAFTLVDNHVYSKEKCGAQLDNIISSTGVKSPIIFGGLYPSSYKGLENDIVNGIQSLFSKINDKGLLDTQVHIYTEYYEDENDIITKAKSLIEKNKVFGILGSVITGKVSSFRELLNSYQVPMIGSLSGHPDLRHPYSRYVVNLRSNVVEEVVSATRFAQSFLTEPDVTVVHSTDQYWSSVVSNITYFYKASSEGISLSYKQFSRAKRASVDWTESLGDVLIVCASAVDVKDFLERYLGKSILILIPSEVIASPEFKGFTFPSNVITTSFLVSFTKATSTNIMAREFLTDFTTYFPSSNKTMESYEGYALGTMVYNILTYMQQANIEMIRSMFISSLFQRSSFELGDDKFGPYGDTCGNTATLSARSISSACDSDMSSCGCNQGANMLYLGQAQSAVNMTLMYTLDIDTCGLKPILNTLSAGAIIGISIGAASCVLCVCLGIILFMCCFRKNSSEKYAPKSGFITCAFTDVQNSTKLWQGNEKAMRESLEIHNQIMRRNLQLYRGYEVKTNGDSFYVAFKDPFDAMLWAMAVQLDLLNAKWPSDLYHEWDCRQEWDSKTRKAYWSGLRVRIGLHYGKGDCVFDKTMKRFDYFGTVVNKSARIEALAHGGQVCVSEDLFYKTRTLYKDVQYLDEANVEAGYSNFLNVDETPTNNSASFSSSSSFSRKRHRIQAERLFSARDLGVYPLKGLSESTRIFEIKCPEIQQREYPPLRVDLGEVERVRSRSNSMYGGSNNGSQQNLYQSQNHTPKHERTKSGQEDVCEYTLTSIDNTLHP